MGANHPALDPDPVVEVFKRDVDRTLLRENLKLTPAAGGPAGSGRAARCLRQEPAAPDIPALLERLQPYLRGAPEGLPFRFDTATISRGLNFTLTTELGTIDLRGEVTGGGSYDALAAKTETAVIGGYTIRCRSAS